MKNIVVFGGAGGAAMVAQTIRRLTASGKAICVSGFLNDTLPIDSNISGVRILGQFDAWGELPNDTMFVAPIYAAKLMQRRMARIIGLQIPKIRWATVVDLMAVVADDATIMSGSFVGPLAIIDANATVGRNVILWPMSQIGHDTVVEDYVFIGRGSVISGRCRIAIGAYIGAGAVVADGLRLGRFSVVGAGAVVIRDVPDHAVVVGNPARITSHLDPSDDPIAS